MTRTRTLVVSPNWIGDAVMAQPLLQLLKQQYPGRPIDVLAPAFLTPVWRAIREVDTVIESRFTRGALQLTQRGQLAKMLRQGGYADAYVLPNTLKSALIPWLAGVPRRIGYRGELRYGLVNVMHHDNPAAPRPMVSFYAALAEPPRSDVPEASASLRPRLEVAPAQQLETLAVFGLTPNARLIVFAPGAEFGSAKRWPATHFATLADSIVLAHPDAQITLLGSDKDKRVCDEVAFAAPHVRNLAGITTLDQAIALLACADAVVSNDSGLLHTASALNRPAIAIYGPTDPDHAPPFSDGAAALSLRLDCSPCRQRECPLGHHRCMIDVTPDMVWKALMPMLVRP